MTTQGLTFYLKSSELSHVNVEVTLIEHKNGELEISAECGGVRIGKLHTSIKAYKFRNKRD